MNRKAFTLIELLVYVFLISLLAFLIAGFCQSMYSSLKTTYKQMDAVLTNALAIDFVVKDVLSASADTQQWDSERGIFRKEELDVYGSLVSSWIGWEIDTLSNAQPCIRRNVGVYDVINCQWIKRTASVYACVLTSLHIIPEREGRVIRCVRIEYTALGKLCTRVVRLRNRIIL